MNKLGIYLHIPFCLRKCLYCDFCSIGGASDADMHRYTDAIIKEMEAYAPKAEKYSVDTIFFGGGTPSLLPTAELSRIMTALYRCYGVEKGAEISLEVNPATADHRTLSAFRTMGFNRISIGVQSLSDIELKALGRMHTVADAYRIYEETRRAGFDNVNLDLMYGIPEQTEVSFARTLDEIIRLSPEHISAYSLIIEEETPFYERRNHLRLPSEEEEERLHHALLSRLSSEGYEHYEISNYARKGYESRHNLHYWRSEPYLGFGVAAHSYFEGERYGNDRDLFAYMEDPLHRTGERVTLSLKEMAYERLMLGLRLCEGIDLHAYRSAFGIYLEEKYRDEISRFSSMGLLRVEDGRMYLTEPGMRLSNSVLVAFMEEDL